MLGVEVEEGVTGVDEATTCDVNVTEGVNVTDAVIVRVNVGEGVIEGVLLAVTEAG